MRRPSRTGEVRVSLTQLSEAIEASHKALAAIIRGDVEPFLALYSDADDITIGNPFGPFAVGRDGTRAAGSRAASNYSDGEIVGFDLITTYATDDLACVVEVERFSVRLANAPEPSSVALRVTSLYRREADGWRLVHRHADPIVELRSAESVANS
jgi:ketosteroid isomerase-like protein